MTFLLLIKATWMLAVGLTATAMLRRASASTRHFVLTLSLWCACVMPVLVPVAPIWGRRVSVELPWATSRATTWWDVVLVLWAVSALLMAVRLTIGLARLRRLGSQATPCVEGLVYETALDIASDYRLPRPVSVLCGETPLGPVTWGHWHPRVLLPADAAGWDREQLVAVLRHELAHVRRRDWLTHLVAESIRAALWWHPLVTIVVRAMRRESEHACDAWVIACGIAPERYSSHLVSLARGRMAVSVVGSHFGAGVLHARVRRILAANDRRTTLDWRIRAAAAAAFVVLALATAGYASTGNVFGRPAVIFVFNDTPTTLTLLTDGRMVDLAKGAPALPDPQVGLVPGTTLATISLNRWR